VPEVVAVLTKRLQIARIVVRRVLIAVVDMQPLREPTRLASILAMLPRPPKQCTVRNFLPGVRTRQAATFPALKDHRIL
jgi:hypothetical protein